MNRAQQTLSPRIISALLALGSRCQVALGFSSKQRVVCFLLINWLLWSATPSECCCLCSREADIDRYVPAGVAASQAALKHYIHNLLAARSHFHCPPAAECSKHKGLWCVAAKHRDRIRGSSASSNHDGEHLTISTFTVVIGKKYRNVSSSEMIVLK